MEMMSSHVSPPVLMIACSNQAVDPPTRIQTSSSDFLAHPQIESLKEKVDTVVAAGGLHWVGDIVGSFTQIKHVLKPDGAFIAAVLGGDTLFELR